MSNEEIIWQGIYKWLITNESKPFTLTDIAALTNIKLSNLIDYFNDFLGKDLIVKNDKDARSVFYELSNKGVIMIIKCALNSVFDNLLSGKMPPLNGIRKLVRETNLLLDPRFK